MPFFSPLPGQPKNMAIINSAILYVSARDLRLLNCRINNKQPRSKPGRGFGYAYSGSLAEGAVSEAD
jgi:hypothetical protein